MKRFGGMAIGLCLFAASSALAQPPPAGGAAPGAGQRAGGPPPMTNLQIIPKETPREQVVATMQSISAALGVQCNYCHVMEGRGGRNDMASDEKPVKKTARQMMVFARELNEKLPAVVGKAGNETTRVGCMTCHRGLAVPKQLTQVLNEAVNAKGLDSAVAQYRELRTKYAGTMAYDMSESGLIAMAQAAVNLVAHVTPVVRKRVTRRPRRRWAEFG